MWAKAFRYPVPVRAGWRAGTERDPDSFFFSFFFKILSIMHITLCFLRPQYSFHHWFPKRTKLNAKP